MIEHFFEFKNNYNSELIRGKNITERSIHTRDIVINHAASNKILLDIGCGTAAKTLAFSDYFREIVGLEPSDDLLMIAKKNIQNQPRHNMRLIKGVGQTLPFKSSQFDIITSILAWWVAEEIHRVLKPNGLFLIECLGPEDKKSFTQLFGKDEDGWRGANLNTNLNEMEHALHEKLGPFFHTIKIHNIIWQTMYCEEGLWLLLNNTKTTVRNFNPVSDRDMFLQAMNKLKKNDQIILNQNRLLITAIRR